MVICLEQGTDLLMPLPLIVPCFSKIQIGFTFTRLTRVVLDKGPLNVCVCVVVHQLFFSALTLLAGHQEEHMVCKI